MVFWSVDRLVVVVAAAIEDEVVAVVAVPGVVVPHCGDDDNL